ncbi:MAG TPA: hypothetical protein VGF97_00640 [Rhizomicrobium sp.]|jgi:hypothetical protein
MHFKFGCVLAGLCLALPAMAKDVPAWRGYAGNAQHTAPAPTTGQPLTNFHWTMAVDLQPPQGDALKRQTELLIHYASPMITAKNTVLVPVKTTQNGAFEIEAVSGTNGHKLWSMKTDYTLPPHDWVPPLPAHLTAQNKLYVAGNGGTTYERDNPDDKRGKPVQNAFYGLSNYQANKLEYNENVVIDTPITADSKGNIYFGFLVQGSTPLKLKSGVARIDKDGNGTWISAGDAANDQTMTQAVMNCAPAISKDGSTIYIGISNDEETGYLVGLDATTLAPKYRVALKDPLNAENAGLSEDGTASPTIGPDNEVYYGVLDAGEHNCRGWLLNFSSDLTKEKTPGSFGWDDTVSIVPSSAVPGGDPGKSPYYLMTKYNNYLGCGSGNGHNMIAILDPKATQKDNYSNATVMKEVETILDPHQVPGETTGAVYEWCINSAVVDASRNSVIANAEDGYTYRWDLATNTLAEMKKLNAPLGEAYTPTIIGPDGTVYAINDAMLYAMGN